MLNLNEIPKEFCDPNWRVNNLYKIVNKQKELITFRQNPVQRMLAKGTHPIKWVLKARQFGITTDGVIEALDDCIFNPNTTCAIMAHKKDVLEKIFMIAHIAYKNMPEAIRPRIDRGGGSKYELRFPEINSKIYVALELRGGTINRLHISEAAFIPSDRIRATLQAVPLGSPVKYETTPNGLNHFHDSWNNADGQKFFFPWYFHTDYRIESKPFELEDDEIELVNFAKAKFEVNLTYSQIAFRRYKIRNEFEGSVQKFLMEYPEDDLSCFLLSGATPFDRIVLQNMLANLPADECFEKIGQGGDSYLKILKPMSKGKTYVIGADVAEGVAKDYSVAKVWCVEDREDVAIFKGKIKPQDYGVVLYELGKRYSYASKWPCLIVERNNHGHAVILKLTDDQAFLYPNLWQDADDRYGHLTNRKSRPPLLDEFIYAIQHEGYVSNFRETLEECLTLVDNNGKIEAEDGKNDDTVIADSLAIKVLKNLEKELRIYKDLKTKIRVG